MHNSQNQQTISGAAPQRFLMSYSCLGCHTGINDPSTTDELKKITPFIYDTAAEYLLYGVESGTNTLAAGTLRYVADASAQHNDSKGHNIIGLSSCDSVHGMTPPGGTSMSSQLTCSGLYGCHGDRSKADPYAAIKFSHHGGNDDPRKNGGTEAYRSYRLLQNVAGYEDSDWEYQPKNDSHNQYKGYDRFNVSLTDELPSPTTAISSSISYFCATCHGNFHNGAGSLGVDSNDTALKSPWIRHPTDIDMSNTGEYANYGGTKNEYMVIAPLGSSTVVSAPLDTVFATSGDAIVTCISCHRAHGSKYASNLRWDYKHWPSSGGLNGCGICHTSKD